MMGKRLLSLAEQLDDATLRRVFTHTSWASERVDSYERLEFLGDSVLSLAVTTELYRRFPAFSEGHLARLRAYVVSRATCAKVAVKLGLGRTMRERANGIAEGEAAQLMTNANVLADLTEALIGALYVTFGYEAVRPAVVEAFSEHIDFAEESYVDHKTELQEYAARLGCGVGYRLVATIGPPHHREFEIEVVIDGEALGRGVGSSKKRAEQDAAAEALAELQDRERRGKRRARLRSRRPEGKAGAGADDGVAEGGADGAEPVAAKAAPKRRPTPAKPAARVADAAAGTTSDTDASKPRSGAKAAKPRTSTTAPRTRAARPAPEGGAAGASGEGAVADQQAEPTTAAAAPRRRGGRSRRRTPAASAA
ncbi:MAG: ribonuclease III, partial [Actinomycetota bacterium]